MQESVLIIDDSLTNVVLVESILKRENLDILKAFSINEALELLKKKNVDLIILDIMFPGKNGKDFLEFRQSNPRLKAIPILVTSAISNDKEINEITSMGISHYFAKPLDIDLFLEKVRSSLKK
jgi:response regulator RpfG family c-di-GMP phosphodiesterase